MLDAAFVGHAIENRLPPRIIHQFRCRKSEEEPMDIMGWDSRGDLVHIRLRGHYRSFPWQWRMQHRQGGLPAASTPTPMGSVLVHHVLATGASSARQEPPQCSACKSARGLDADRHAKPLTSQHWVGSLSGADPQSGDGAAVHVSSWPTGDSHSKLMKGGFRPQADGQLLAPESR
jgi:hypothetical protein